MMIKGSSLCRLLRQDHLVLALFLITLMLFPGLVRAEWPGVGENLAVCTASGEQYIPQIVSDGLDGCVIIWFDARSGMELINVFGQRVSAQGDILWTPSGVQLTNVPSYTWISFLVACADGDGGAFFAWEDPRNANFDVYVQHVDSNGTTLWTADGVRLSMTGDEDYVMDIASDEMGGCIVAWYTAGATESILAQRINAAGAKVWDSAGVVVSLGTNYATRAQIASDGYGGVVACWLDGRYHPSWNDFKDIYAQRVDSSGVVCWADTGVTILGLGSAPFYSFPELVGDGSGQFFIAWYDWRSGNFDIRAQSVSDSGQTLWTANGNVVCQNPDDQVNPHLASGAAGELFCAWRDANTSIRAQLLDASGTMFWPVSGIVTASSSSGLDLGSALHTSDGLYAVVYGENIGSTQDVLVKAQALDASGSLIWNAGGEPVSTVASPKSNIGAIPDTSGGIIAAWTDDRNGSYTSDIFAQRVDPSVSISETKFFTKGVSSLQVTPNPCRNSVVVRFGLDQNMPVNLSLYDIKGCRIRNLVFGMRTAGVHPITWDVKDGNGVALPDGVYFLSLETVGTERIMRKVIVLP